jgi:hypothetical protein
VERLLKRHRKSKLADVIPKAEGETAPLKKTVKSYEQDFIYIGIKYLPQIANKSSRRYLFVAIDRATHWVFLYTYADITEMNNVDFLRRLKLTSPVKISKILTGHGSQFTDHFNAKDKKPTGRHAFEISCASIAVEPRLAPPQHPQNGMVERFKTLC